MSELTPSNEDRPEELIRAENLIDDAKVNEAHELLDNFERKKGITLRDKVSCRLLNGELLIQQGKYIEVIKLAEEIYNESLDLGKDYLSVDALLLMAIALMFLNRTDKALEFIRQGEDILSTLSIEHLKEYKQREAHITLLKGQLYGIKGKIEKSLKFLEQSLKLSEELGVKHEIAQSLSTISYYILIHKGEIDRALKISERALFLAKECGKRYLIAGCLNRHAGALVLKGELDRSIILFEQSLAIFKEFDNKRHMAMVLNNIGEKYRMKGDLNRGLECSKQSIALSKEIGNDRATAIFHDFLIQILIDKGEIEQAWRYLQDLEQLAIKLQDKDIERTYLSSS
jgi:tetratricopeptide (TPR) repeat protein